MSPLGWSFLLEDMQLLGELEGRFSVVVVVVVVVVAASPSHSKAKYKYSRVYDENLTCIKTWIQNEGFEVVEARQEAGGVARFVRKFDQPAGCGF